MVTQNTLVALLRLFVGLKSMFTDLTSKQNLLIPAVFGTIWLLLAYLSYKKNGDYGAPWGLLYSQQEEER